MFGATVAQRQLVHMGCYSSTNGFINLGSYPYQSIGYCREQCKKQGRAVGATTRGSDCLCGTSTPSPDSRINDGLCGIRCRGYGNENCGGEKTFSVFLTGIANVANDPDGASDSSNQPSPSTSQAIETSTIIASSLLLESTLLASSIFATTLITMTKEGVVEVTQAVSSKPTVGTAITTVGPGNSTSDIPISTPQPANRGHEDVSVGKTAGIAVGAAVVIFLVLFTLIVWHYKRKALSIVSNQSTPTSIDSTAPPSRVAPFVQYPGGSINDFHDYMSRPEV